MPMLKSTLPVPCAMLCAAALLFTSTVSAETVATISAPPQAGMNETIEIQYTGPNASGDTLRIADTEGKMLGGSYVYVGNLKGGPGKLSAPLKPGDYQVVYVSNREIIASSPLRVVPVTARVSAPSTVTMNASIPVTFEGPNNSGDQIRITTPDGKAVGGLYAYVGHAKGNALSINAPAQPGEYQVAYLTSTAIIGTSPLTVQSATAKVSAPATVGANESFSAQFEGPMNSGDYLQVVTADGEPVSGHYAYVGLSRDGTIPMKAPVDPGQYSVAYFTARQNIGETPIEVTGAEATLTVSGPVQAGAHFKVDWEGPENSGDRIDVTRTTGEFLGSYAYVGNNPGTVTLRAPEETGTYQVVYRTARRVIGQAQFDVEPVSASLQAPDTAPGNERVAVEWNGPGNRGDTVQLIDPATGQDAAYAYVDAKRGQTVHLLAPPTPGAYVLKYITHGKRELATRAIEITPPARQPGTLTVQRSDRPRLELNDAVEVVLDASGSMLQRQNGERRIEIAKRTLEKLVSETIPAGTPFALRVFGHREADSCRTDLEIPLRPLQPATASASLNAVVAMNLAKTPIAESLLLTHSDLAGVSGERIIVLVTDGEETCDGDPAGAIASLRTEGANVRVNIVGYAIDDDALRDTFSRWANLGGGAYFDASSEDDLGAALTSSVNPSFEVLNADNAAVARGVAGAGPITLPPGDYRVRAGAREQAVTIVSEQDHVVTLD